MGINARLKDPLHVQFIEHSTPFRLRDYVTSPQCPVTLKRVHAWRTYLQRTAIIELVTARLLQSIGDVPGPVECILLPDGTFDAICRDNTIFLNINQFDIDSIDTVVGLLAHECGHCIANDAGARKAEYSVQLFIDAMLIEGCCLHAQYPFEQYLSKALHGKFLNYLRNISALRAQLAQDIALCSTSLGPMNVENLYRLWLADFGPGHAIAFTAIRTEFPGVPIHSLLRSFGSTQVLALKQSYPFRGSI